MAKIILDWKNDEDVLHDLQTLPERLHANNQGLAIRPGGDAPDWYGYECAIWDLGEFTRQYIQPKRKLRGKIEILDQIERICIDSRFGKGRRPYIFILGQYGRGEYNDTLGTLIDDPHVYGHAIDALATAKAPGYETRVQDIIKSEKRAWIRNSGKKYLRRVAPEAHG